MWCTSRGHEYYSQTNQMNCWRQLNPKSYVVGYLFCAAQISKPSRNCFEEGVDKTVTSLMYLPYHELRFRNSIITRAVIDRSIPSFPCSTHISAFISNRWYLEDSVVDSARWEIRTTSYSGLTQLRWDTSFRTVPGSSDASIPTMEARPLLLRVSGWDDLRILNVQVHWGDLRRGFRPRRRHEE